MAHQTSGECVRGEISINGNHCLKPTAAFARADHRGSRGKALINCSAIRHKIRQSPKRGSTPFLETLQYQADAWSGRSKPRLQLRDPKINLICSPRIGDVSDIKLIRTDFFFFFFYSCKKQTSKGDIFKDRNIAVLLCIILSPLAFNVATFKHTI